MDIQIKNNKIYAPLLNKWVKLSSEEKLKQEFINDLVNIHHYQLDQLGQDIKLSDVNFVDIAIWKNAKEKQQQKTPAIVIAIDCNAEWSKITQNEAKQKYAALSIETDFLVIKNLRETRIYYVEKGKPIEQLFSDIIEFPDLRSIQDKTAISKFVENKKDTSRNRFNQVLLKCHNIIRNNDKLSPEAAFDEMSKILFLKFEYEKEKKGEIVFSKDQFIKEEKLYIESEAILSKSVSNSDYMQIRFETIKERLRNEKIFDPTDTIKIRRTSFEQILEELEVFNLIKIDDDIKGLAFESFLSRTFRGELGQFFTPRPVVEFMVNILDPNEGEVICDPCCGSGGFLISTFNYIREKIESSVKDVISQINSNTKASANDDIFKFTEIINHEWDKTNINGRFYKLSHDYIFGTDANPRMARTAKMNMIMHGDGHGGVHHHDGLLNVNGIWENKFDVILTNPPFGSKLDKSIKVTLDDLPSDEQIKEYTKKYGDDYIDKIINPMKLYATLDNGKDKTKGKAIIDLFDSGRFTGLTEVLFIERCLNLLKPGGRMGIVLPDGVLNNTNLQNIRELFEGKAKIVLIVSIPQDVFMASGATVKPSLVFLKKFTEKEECQYKITVRDAKAEIESKYVAYKKELMKFIENKNNNRTDIELKRDELKILKTQIDKEMKMLIKERFDYQIPIAQVEKAGITTTGTECENELIYLWNEYTPYRIQNRLWQSTSKEYHYKVENNKLLRKLNDKEWIELC